MALWVRTDRPPNAPPPQIKARKWLLSVLPPAFANLFLEFISCLSNHTRQNKHAFHSGPFPFVWAVLWSVFLLGRRRKTNSQQTGFCLKLPVKLWSICVLQGRWNLGLWDVVLACPVSRQVNEPVKKERFLLSPLLPLVPVIVGEQTGPRREREEGG